MAMLKCKMCGGDLEVTEGMTVCECEYCGSKQTISSVDDEKIIKLYDRANRLRMANEFDKALGVYESIVEESDTEAEAYWGLILCKYGIEYVDDPASGDKIPTCHRVSFDSVMEDPDFELVMENADALSKSVYRESAKQIEEIRKGIIEVSGKEEPYDIFICYKETADDGDRTVDSVMAQEVYDALTDKGYRVFFSRITLEDKLGQEYEPYIFAALNSAKIMLAFGTSYDYYNAVWVKNEWSRYLKLMAKDKEKHLIPCYKDIDAYDMPKEFKHLQAQDMGKIGAIQDLVRGIGKIIGNKNPATNTGIQTNATPGALTVRGNLSLEDGDFEKAYEFFERSLDDNPADAKAYIGKVLANLHIKNLEELKNCKKLVDLDRIPDFKHALQFSIGQEKTELEEIYELLEKKTQVKYFMRILKKRARLIEIEEIKEKDRQRNEKDRKLKEQQAAYEAAVARINEQIKNDFDEESKEIYASAEARKKPILGEMENKMQEIQAIRSQLDEQWRKLDYQRASLGFFKGKQKTELLEQIDVIKSRMKALPSDEDIRADFSPRINEINDSVTREEKELEASIRARYSMPLYEDYVVE